MPNNSPVFYAKNVTKTFGHGKTLVKAVDDVSFSIADGEIVSIVGGSGCGKSVLAKVMPSRIPAAIGTKSNRYSRIPSVASTSSSASVPSSRIR